VLHLATLSRMDQIRQKIITRWKSGRPHRRHTEQADGIRAGCLCSEVTGERAHKLKIGRILVSSARSEQ